MSDFTFDEPTIQALFGKDAAEDESIERLREYYFKSDVFDKINNELPLRILVGHKGVGKSALFKVAMNEALENKMLALWVRPDDILSIETDQSDVLKTIRDWKNGINDMIISLVLNSVGINNVPSILEKVRSLGGGLLNILTEVLGKKADEYGVNISEAKTNIVNNFLSTKKILLFIDDLDRGWSGDENSIKRVSGLLNAVRDMTSANPGLLFRISLRSDVYFLVRTSDESTDKIDGNVIWLSWTQHQLLVLLAKRIDTYFGYTVDEKELMRKSQAEVAKSIYRVFEERFYGHGKWDNIPTHRVLATLIRKRPRDLVKLCTLAAREAKDNEHKKIGTDDLDCVFDRYSQDRIQDTINEHRYELPEIERLLLGMAPSKKKKRTADAYMFSKEELLTKLINISSKPFYFAKVKEEEPKKVTPEQLLHFMYKINFIVGRKEAENGEIDRRYFEDQNYLTTTFKDFGYKWEIHPAFRWALYPEGRETLYMTDLNSEL